MFSDEKNVRILDQTEKGFKSIIHANIYQFILRNLLINSVKYSYKSQNIYINAYPNKDNLEVAVTDMGVGISENNLKEIFRFTGKTDLGTMNEKGTGIGLMLCYETLQQCGGKLWAESILGAGATFYFSVPFKRA